MLRRLAKLLGEEGIISRLVVNGLPVVVVVRQGRVHIRKRQMGEMRENFVGGFTGLGSDRYVPHPHACAGYAGLSAADSGGAGDMLLGLCDRRTAHSKDCIGVYRL